ncbi:FBP domain-containing protein [Streptomyces sp. NPDC088354]|uniref:FBP domain-containing protein n=1 Tax=unclassified Streptomyces TaxID=2593676 RepID=UPI0029A860DD|nr:FBP domain-containing protein [Streptomyces sp. MI02-7b]MDX3073273.1 FBP domain-containing protein [Streptomyces sp. MI02-7b]
MDPLTETEIRDAFVNCSKGEARRANLPRDLAELPWADLDFLGWRDPGAPDRGYLVAERHGRMVGLSMRAPSAARRSLLRTSLCSICLTSHASSGVDLLAAPKVGPSGRQGNTVGTYICADLACSLYVRGKKTSALVRRMEETLTPEERVERARANLAAFLDKVFDGAQAPA